MLNERVWDGHVCPSEVGIAVHDGIVTLSGEVGSYLVRMAAREAAHRMRGVRTEVKEISARLLAVAERTDRGHRLCDLQRADLGHRHSGVQTRG